MLAAGTLLLLLVLVELHCEDCEHAHCDVRPTTSLPVPALSFRYHAVCACIPNSYSKCSSRYRRPSLRVSLAAHSSIICYLLRPICTARNGGAQSALDPTAWPLHNFSIRFKPYELRQTWHRTPTLSQLIALTFIKHPCGCSLLT